MAKKSFEQALQQLEQIVHEMESGDLPLEKAIKKFEEGIELSNSCSKMLDETEKKITLLIRDKEGRMVEEPFIEENSDTDGKS